MTDSRVQSTVATALRIPLLVGRPVARQVRNYIVRPILAHLEAVFDQLRALSHKLRTWGRWLTWALVLPVLALSLAGLVTGFVFGLVLARISVVLEVFPSSEKSTKVVSEIASPKAKKKVLIQVSPGQPGHLSQIRAVTDSTRTEQGKKSPHSANVSPGTHSRTNSFSGTYAATNSYPPASYPVSAFPASVYAAQLDAGIHKAFPKAFPNGKDLHSRFPSTPPESAWETEDDLSHSDDDLTDDTAGPSQIEFYSQFRLPGVHDPVKGRHMADDAFGDGYKTPPARVRTPPSRSPRLVRIREDTEV